MPGELAAEMARAGSQGFEVWLQAREANDFAVFEPALRRNIELAREYAACFPEAEHPYDALLDRYEPGTTTAQVRTLFATLRDGLVPLLAEIAAQAPPAPLNGAFPVAAQREVGLEIVHAMGFDESAWRLDDAVHPFAASPSQRRRARHVALRRREPHRAVRAHARGRPRPLRARHRPGARPHDARHGRLARHPRVAEPHVGEPRRPQRAVLEPLAAAAGAGDARDARRRRARATSCGRSTSSRRRSSASRPTS